jgi:hypothetical protein
VDDPARRVSDREREEAVAALRDDLLAGRVTLDEFSERVESAYRARTGGELVRVRRDLPAAPPRARRRPARTTLAFFGHVVRRGRLRLRRRTLAVSLFADVDLDLREAEIDDERVTVRVLAVFGNVDVYVPEGVDVDVGGTLLGGRRRDWGADRGLPGLPTLRVRAYGVFGTVDVWRVPHGVRGDYGQITRELRGRQRALPA